MASGERPDGRVIWVAPLPNQTACLFCDVLGRIAFALSLHPVYRSDVNWFEVWTALLVPQIVAVKQAVADRNKDMRLALAQYGAKYAAAVHHI